MTQEAYQLVIVCDLLTYATTGHDPVNAEYISLVV